MFFGFGCKSEVTQAEATEPVEAEPVDAAIPKSGGSVVWALEGEPVHLDSHLVVSQMAMNVSFLFFDRLWVYNEDYTGYTPNLADSWEWTDNTTLKINVRKGVLFHNGREMTAEDVKYSIDRILDPNTGSPRKDQISAIENVELIDDYTLNLNLSYPFPGIMDYFIYIAIVPKEAVEQYGDLKTNPVGTGPFIFEKWDKGLQIVGKKNENYWQEGKPYLDEIIVKFMPEYNAGKNALITGEIDVLNVMEILDYDTLSNTEGIKLYQVPNVMIPYFVAINCSREPLKDPRVRKAISMSMDRDLLNQSAYNGLATLMYSVIPPDSDFYNPNMEIEYNIEEAKKLLEEAGYPEGITLDFLEVKIADHEVASEIVQANLQEIGINSELRLMEVAEFLTEIFDKGNFDITLFGDNVTYDPSFFMNKYFKSDGANNIAVGNWSNERVDELIDLAKSELDRNKQKEYWMEVQDILAEEWPLITYTNVVRIFPMRERVMNYWMQNDLTFHWEDVWVND